ncbi:DUF1707 domain-containing protein [Planotetraspora sp. A-T 1434]|uniref:DUF1707 SHOCT-like domain-containing protein n=1 Tax=Planotetraspora sp. A-T 1434 TaxID=2979219 RepID=UPI0021BFAA26|nr:DUF1707 domain-containing protein [Planotetraspora sp. A-T 1434]MCT9930960.1 DUF1707 domain-containing protein [Planotetraspora sp. A-T 1434]
MRVADMERDRACAILREHFAVGRLSKDELTLRVAAVEYAITWGDLDEIFADLPRIPGMEISPTPPPVPSPAPPPPGVYLAPPILVAANDPGSGQRAAAWACFILGFFTGGLTWIPAIILAIVAAGSRRRSVQLYPAGAFPTAPRARSHTGVVVASVIGTVALVGVGVTVIHQNAQHTVEVEISSAGGAVAGQTDVTTPGGGSSAAVKLPHEATYTFSGSVSDVTVSASEAHYVSGKKKGKKAPVTCTIIVDRNIVDQSTSDGNCFASYSE